MLAGEGVVVVGVELEPRPDDPLPLGLEDVAPLLRLGVPVAGVVVLGAVDGRVVVGRPVPGRVVVGVVVVGLVVVGVVVVGLVVVGVVVVGRVVVGRVLVGVVVVCATNSVVAPASPVRLAFVAVEPPDPLDAPDEEDDAVPFSTAVSWSLAAVRFSFA